MKPSVAASLLLPLLALGALPPRASAQMLRLDQLQGSAELTRGDTHPPLNAETAIVADDQIRVGAGSKLSLRLGRHGILELGAGSELTVERLPFASYADDLRTILRLRRGFLRVIWKQPPLDIKWPLFVYMDSDRAALLSGEYFFEVGSEINAICVAEGGLALQGGSRDEAQALEPDTCYRMVPGVPPQPRDQRPEDWIAVRANRALDRSMWAMPAVASSASPPVTATAAAAPPLPGITAPVVTPPAVRPVPPKPAEKPAEKPAVKSVAKAPVPAPASPPRVVAAAAVAGGGWTLNLASFPDQASADKELARLKKAGFPGVVTPADVKGRNWYRVQIQGLASREEAQGMAEQLKGSGFMQAWILKPGQ
ncbi:SPOR domain-containing protein [Hydrocarboniphaga sp.]|uniref:SPOR domain-containing protein n=1 Tax=Hydrocarboniphaga sp. TaxID=2033016 RepID=UPI003D0D2674